MFLLLERARSFLHGRDGAAEQVIGPYNNRKVVLPKDIGRRGVVFRRDDDDRAAIAPFLLERQDFIGHGQGAVDQDAVGAGLAIGFGAAQRFGEPPAADEGFDPGDDGKVLVALGVFAGFDLAAELVHVRHGLGVALDEAVRFGEELVFDAHRGNLALLQLADEALHVVEVAVAGVAVEENRNRGGVGHEFEGFEHLRPAGFVVVAHAELG